MTKKWEPTGERTDLMDEVEAKMKEAPAVSLDLVLRSFLALGANAAVLVIIDEKETVIACEAYTPIDSIKAQQAASGVIRALSEASKQAKQAKRKGN